MSTMTYCDAQNGDCRNSENDTKLFAVVDNNVAEALVKRGWFSTKYDIHICDECYTNYYNECDDQLSLDENEWIVLGGDFKQRGDKQ